MSLALKPTELLARARADLRMGVPVLLARGDEELLVFSAETLSAERFADLRAMGMPLCLTVSARRAETLKAVAYDGDVARLSVPDDANLAWVQAVADPADDLRSPMKGPFQVSRGGEPELHRMAVRIAKDARLLPAVLVSPLAQGTGRMPDITRVDHAAVSDLLGRSAELSCAVSARVPLSVSEAGRVHVFRPDDGGEEHYAIEIGAPSRTEPVLSRLHSACFTGDLLGSLKCDCGPQLRAALGQMGAEGRGVLLYLNQEGRGIGLANKMRAYALQDEGFDTVEANHRLGFEDDERDFRIGAEILRAMGFGSIRLLTNNPAKVRMMEHTGITVVERVPLRVGRTPQNDKYLRTKADKSGHLL